MDSFCCSKLAVSAFLKSNDCGSAEDLRTMRNHILATITRSITANLHPQVSLLDNRVIISFPEIHLPDEMHVGSGVWGSGGIPGVPPPQHHSTPHTHTHSKMRSRWLFIVRAFVWWEAERRRKGREGSPGEKRNLSHFLSLSGATFICSVFVPTVTAALPARLMIWQYLQRGEVFLKKNNSKTKQKQNKNMNISSMNCPGFTPCHCPSLGANKQILGTLHYIM